MVLSSLSSEAHNIKKVKLNAPPPANLTKPRYIKVLVSVTIGMGDFIHILKAMVRFVFFRQPNQLVCSPENKLIRI
jgi:hypothetical protein